MNDIFEKIAEAYGVSVQEVLEEMTAAIAAGKNQTDPQVQEVWNELFDGDELTPQEFILRLAFGAREKQDII